jgi:4-amino-4-deoxy-L-arabinose transferase-like glycosyltransferase
MHVQQAASSRQTIFRSSVSTLNLSLVGHGRLVAVLVLSLVLRLVWVALVPNEQYSDSVWYDGVARNVAASGMYGLDGPSAWFPPGYPLFLATLYKLFGYSQLTGKLANVAIGLGVSAFTYLLARSLSGGSVALVSALLIAVWPNLIFHTGILSSDLLAAFGFVTALWLGTRPSTHVRTVLLGLLIGWMILVRPVSGILLVSLALLWWQRTGGQLAPALRQLAPVVLIAALIVGSWTFRNYVTFGEPILIATNGGYNFWQVNQRFADGNDTFWVSVPMDDPEYQVMRNGDEFTRNREGYRYGLAYIREHPDRFFALIPAKLFWLYHTDTSGLYEGALYAPMLGPSPLVAWMSAHERLVESATFRYYEALLVLAAIGAMFGLIIKRRVTLVSIVAVPLPLTFFHLFFHAKDRFHVPLDPFIAILAAIALVSAFAWASHQVNRLTHQ